MTPARRAIPRMSHAIPRHCVSLCIHIVGIATFADTVESSPNRIACETAASARELPAFLAAHVGPMVCAWVRHFARGSDDMRVGPLIRTWVRWYARQRRPGAYLGVGVRVAGLTRIFSGSRAARQVRRRCAHNADHLAHDTPLSAFVTEVVCDLGATLPRGATSPTVNGGIAPLEARHADDTPKGGS